MIQMFHVYKTYPNNHIALVNLSLKVDRGAFAYIIGPNGAGKTTVLKLILCVERLTKGQIFVDGTNITRMRKSSIPYLRRRIGGIFQDFKLLNHSTVFENIALAAEVVEARKRKVKKKVWDALGLVGLHNKSDLYPYQLSGGEQKRVAIARAMVNNPLILLADEPTDNLDPEVAVEIMNLLGTINVHGTTVVVATNNPRVLHENQGNVFVLGKLEDRQRFNGSG